MLINAIKSNATSILTGLAIFGVGWTAVETAKSTLRASDILKREGINHREQPKEAIKATWKCYRTPACIFLSTSACILSVPYLYERDMKKLVAALAYSEAKRIEYREATKRVFGEQAEAVDAEIATNYSDIPDDPLQSGKMWCWESESEQWFQTSSEEINHVELVANKMFANHGYLTLNQMLDLFTNAKKVDFGDHFGWYRYDPDGFWDYNWSFYPWGTPWIDIQPQIDKERGVLILKYGMKPGDDLDCHDLEEPEQYRVTKS